MSRKSAKHGKGQQFPCFVLTIKHTRMKKVKIGKGYLQSGYGRGFKKTPTIWLINGKAYAKDSKATPFQTDLEGYVMVNFVQGNFQYPFCQVGLISEHIAYKVN